nr:hypothetical protein [Tanacetum cinerariifolium]
NFKLNGDAAYDLLTKRQSFKASTFYTSRRPAPVIGKEAYLFQLDEKPAPVLNPERLAQAEAALEAAATPAPVLDTKQASVLQQALGGDKPLPVPAAIAPAPPKPAAAIVAPSHDQPNAQPSWLPIEPVSLPNGHLQISNFFSAATAQYARYPGGKGAFPAQAFRRNGRRRRLRPHEGGPR